MRIVIAGGGIAGVEAALTLAKGHPTADVTLIHQWPSLRLLPNLVYVPFGVSPHRLDIPIAESLEPLRIRCISGTIERIDRAANCVTVDGFGIAYDALIIATGTVPSDDSARTLRSLDDALRLRHSLYDIAEARRGDIAVVQRPENTWPAPGYELAALLGMWRTAWAVEHVDISLVTATREPLSMFGIDATDIVTSRLAELGVDLVSGVPAGRVEGLATGVTIDMVALTARAIEGGPAVADDGFYRTRDDGSVDDRIYVVGDAAAGPFKAAFATARQCRRMLVALGGDIERLGTSVDGVPVSECEFQMDLGGQTLVVRMPFGPDPADDATMRVKHAELRSNPPQKLRGTLVRQLLVDNRPGPNPAATFQHVLRYGDRLQGHR